MLGIMNGFIRTATRTSNNETSHDREARFRRQQRPSKTELRDAFDRELSHPRGYW